MNMKRIESLFIGVLAVALTSVFQAHAEDAIEPMSGAGGVMRDAERRAMTPVNRMDFGARPEIKAAKSDEDPRLKKVSGRVLGPVSSVRTYGSSAFAVKEDVADLVMKKLAAVGGRDKTVGDVMRALGESRTELMSRGYYLAHLSMARKNTYDPDTQVLSILVDEGRFGKLSVKFGDESDEGVWYSKSQILNRFRTINEGESFDYNRLRAVLFDANSHPDLTIDTSIDVRKPIEGEGNDRRIARYADLNLTVRESFPLHAVFEVNNHGMEEVEEWQASLTLQYLNLTKHDDTLTLSPAMSIGGEMKSVAASYMIPHYWWVGGNTTLYGGWSDLDVDDIVPSLDLEGCGWFTGLQHSEYLYDGDRHLWAFSAGILWRYIEDQYTALRYKLNSREVSIMPISAALSYTGKKPDALGGRNFGTLQGVLNVTSSGDSLDEMWTDAEENYWILRAQLARLQPLFGWYDEKNDKELHQWMLFMKLEAQYTTDTLIPIEKLSMGGHNCMRGYHTRGYIGDYGAYGTFELRTPILVDTFSSLFGDRTAKTPVDRLQFLGFIDYGWTAFNDLPASYGDDSEYLYSAGLGVRLSVTKYTQLKCDVAFPLRDTDWADDDSMEVYLSAQVQF